MAAARSSLEVSREGAVAHVRLDRPEKRNAFDDHLARALAETFHALSRDPAVRVVVFGGNGPVFCAGGDLEWMRRAAAYSPEENLRDAEAFQRAYEEIDRCEKPVVARVHGAAVGGGVGLVSVCDVAVAATATVFSLSEVRLGILPGVVAPYLLRKVGVGECRRLFLTAERFDADEARRIGLVHRVVPAEALDVQVDAVVRDLLHGSTEGQRHAKALIRRLDDEADPAARAEAARRAIAEARASDDGREGIRAFLEKRKPRWAP